MQTQKNVKKAMILAAGVGSRLEPLTNTVPKPITPICNQACMDIILNNLKACGIENVIANTHYLANKIRELYKKNPILPIKFLNETNLSGTAGGLKKCEPFFNDEENFVVLSSDGLCDINLNDVIKSHLESNAIATLVTKEISKNDVYKYGVIVTDENNFVTKFQEKPKVEDALSRQINTGIYVFNKRIFGYIPQNTFFDFAKNVFPALLKNKEKINTYNYKGYWTDIGTIEEYVRCNNDVFENNIHLKNINILNFDEGRLISNTNLLNLPQSLKLEGNCVIGKNCQIGENVRLKNVIIWDNVIIKSDVTLENVVVGNDFIISESFYNKILANQKELVTV